MKYTHIMEWSISVKKGILYQLGKKTICFIVDKEGEDVTAEDP